MTTIITANLSNSADLFSFANQKSWKFSDQSTDTVSKVTLLFKKAIQEKYHLIAPDPTPTHSYCQTAKKVVLVIGAVLGALITSGITAGTMASHISSSLSFSIISYNIPWVSVVIRSTTGALAAICTSALLKNPVPLKERFHPFVHKIFSAALEECGLSKTDLDSLDSVEALKSKLQEEGFVTIGSCPDLPINPQDNEVSSMVRFLLTNASLSYENITWKLIKGICLTRNEDLFQTAIAKFQQILDFLFEELKKPTLSSSNEKTIEVLLGNILAYYPFLGPNEKNSLSIPQKIQGSWERITYSTNPIQLTPDSLGSPQFCYGLKPLDHQEANPLLLFMGTSHPTASGLQLAIWTDFIPFTTVGESIYSLFGKEKIEGYLKNNNGKKAKLYGLSLGGSTALLTVADFPQYVAEVHAYSCPSPLSRVTKKYDINTKALSEKPRVHIYCQGNDFIPLIGNGWHPDWHIDNIFVLEDYISLLAHIKSFAGDKEVLFLKASSRIENSRLSRKITHLVHQIFSIPICLIHSHFLLLKSIVVVSKNGIAECFA